MWPRSRTSRSAAEPAGEPPLSRPGRAAAQAPRVAANASLRVHLLRALATPLFALVLVSGSLSYWLAAHYTTQVFDRALYGVANNIAQQIRIAGPRLEQDIPMIAQTLVEAEGTDRIYWRIHGPDGLIGGMDTWLGYGTDQTTLHDARLFLCVVQRPPGARGAPASHAAQSRDLRRTGHQRRRQGRAGHRHAVAELLGRRETAASDPARCRCR
ncbi:sensor histidine kinase N-terminal domain-containing protein [Cupriavidus basilensis]